MDFHIVTELVHVFLEFEPRRGESLGYRQREVDTVLLVDCELVAGHVEMDSNAARLFDDDEPEVLQALRASGQSVDVFLERFDVSEDLSFNLFGHLRFGLRRFGSAFFPPSPERFINSSLIHSLCRARTALRRLMSCGIRAAT